MDRVLKSHGPHESIDLSIVLIRHRLDHSPACQRNSTPILSLGAGPRVFRRVRARAQGVTDRVVLDPRGDNQGVPRRRDPRQVAAHHLLQAPRPVRVFPKQAPR